MSVRNFVPKLWSARLLANLDKKLVFRGLVNTDYEGEIAQFGDSVVINQMGNITIKDYDGSDIDTPDDVTSVTQTLLIDQAKYFNFKVKDIDAAQANVELVDRAMDRAAYAIGDEIDRAIAGLVVGAGIHVGTVASPIEITVSNAYDKLVDLGVKLDEENVSRVGRNVVLPAWYLGLLSKDPRFTANFTILENGVVEGASVGGFGISMSNNIKRDATDTSIYHIPAMTDAAISFAAQVTETEAYRPESNFADAVKGLYVYGHKVVEPKALVEFVVKQGA
jgi:hypothetical protein